MQFDVAHLTNTTLYFYHLLTATGLSLIEMAIGVYPIPPPDLDTLEELLSKDVADPTAYEQKNVPVFFELLYYIVHEPPPKLEHRIFSDEFKEFVDMCLKKNPDERADLKTLTVSISC